MRSTRSDAERDEMDDGASVEAGTKFKVTLDKDEESLGKNEAKDEEEDEEDEDEDEDSLDEHEE